jgi:hypothetical protein
MKSNLIYSIKMVKEDKMKHLGIKRKKAVHVVS